MSKNNVGKESRDLAAQTQSIISIPTHPSPMDCVTSVLSSSHALPAYTCSPKSKVPAEHPFSHFTGLLSGAGLPDRTTCQTGHNDLISPLSCHRQKAQGLGRTAFSYEKVEAVPTSPAHPAEVIGKHKAGDTAHVHGCEEPNTQ